jgi:hypothetical protein
MFIKGLSTDRDANDSDADYVVVKDQEDIGIRRYIHKFHLGLQPYYWKKVHEDKMKELTREKANEKPEEYYLSSMELRKSIHDQQKRMTQDSFQMFLRVQL